jgi:hypothetical protein
MGGLRAVIGKARTGRCNSWDSPADLTLRGNQGRLGLSPEAARTERSAKNASAGMNQSREAHLAARPLHSPKEPCTRRRFRTRHDTVDLTTTFAAKGLPSGQAALTSQATLSR